MSLEAVDKGTTDEYSCTADNGIGEAVSATTRLFVNYPPEVAIEKVRRGTGLLGTVVSGY